VDTAALKLSFQLAALTTLALLVVGLPIAQWLATTRWRGKVLVEAVVALPLVLPPTVLGFYLLVLFGPRTPLGRAWAELFGKPLPFSFPGCSSRRFSTAYPSRSSRSRPRCRASTGAWSRRRTRSACRASARSRA
jgi:ABC-type molybdate transport system permease subunit